MITLSSTSAFCLLLVSVSLMTVLTSCAETKRYTVLPKPRYALDHNAFVSIAETAVETCEGLELNRAGMAFDRDNVLRQLERDGYPAGERNLVVDEWQVDLEYRAAIQRALVKKYNLQGKGAEADCLALQQETRNGTRLGQFFTLSDGA